MGTAPIPVYTEFFVRYVWVYMYPYEKGCGFRV